MKGQAFEVFKILLGAVIAVVLLVIVMGATGNLTYPEAGFEATARLVAQAAKAPGECFGAERVRFASGESADLAALTGRSGGLVISVLPAFQPAIIAAGSRLTATEDITAPVSARCASAGFGCEVWVGSRTC
ncbi:hypothetical protein HY546_02945 [archaeon]|nr:hypothetical protein [archaeon]